MCASEQTTHPAVLCERTPLCGNSDMCDSEQIKHAAVEDSDVELFEGNNDVEIVQAVSWGCAVEVVDDEL